MSMNLPRIPNHLSARATSKINPNRSTSTTLPALKFYYLCIAKIESGDSKWVLNTDDVPENVVSTVKKRLEEAGYKIICEYGMFIIKNPFISRT
jgi:hypothetical protein